MASDVAPKTPEKPSTSQPSTSRKRTADSPALERPPKVVKANGTPSQAASQVAGSVPRSQPDPKAVPARSKQNGPSSTSGSASSSARLQHASPNAKTGDKIESPASSRAQVASRDPRLAHRQSAEASQDFTDSATLKAALLKNIQECLRYTSQGAVAAIAEDQARDALLKAEEKAIIMAPHYDKFHAYKETAEREKELADRRLQNATAKAKKQHETRDAFANQLHNSQMKMITHMVKASLADERTQMQKLLDDARRHILEHPEKSLHDNKSEMQAQVRLQCQLAADAQDIKVNDLANKVKDLIKTFSDADQNHRTLKDQLQMLEHDHSKLVKETQSQYDQLRSITAKTPSLAELRDELDTWKAHLSQHHCKPIADQHLDDAPAHQRDHAPAQWEAKALTPLSDRRSASVEPADRHPGASDGSHSLFMSPGNDQDTTQAQRSIGTSSDHTFSLVKIAEAVKDLAAQFRDLKLDVASLQAQVRSPPVVPEPALSNTAHTKSTPEVALKMRAVKHMLGPASGTSEQYFTPEELLALTYKVMTSETKLQELGTRISTLTTKEVLTSVTVHDGSTFQIPCEQQINNLIMRQNRLEETLRRIVPQPRSNAHLRVTLPGHAGRTIQLQQAQNGSQSQHVSQYMPAGTRDTSKDVIDLDSRNL